FRQWFPAAAGHTGRAGDQPGVWRRGSRHAYLAKAAQAGLDHWRLRGGGVAQSVWRGAVFGPGAHGVDWGVAAVHPGMAVAQFPPASIPAVYLAAAGNAGGIRL